MRLNLLHFILINYNKVKVCVVVAYANLNSIIAMDHSLQKKLN